MLWFEKKYIREVMERCPDAKLMIAKLEGAFGGKDEALVATFSSPEAEKAALVRLGYGKLKEVKQEPRQ